MKQHPNSGATIWAAIAQKDRAPNKVLDVGTFPAGRRVLTIATGETSDPGAEERVLRSLDGYLTSSGMPFRVAHVERWFLREVPGQGALIGNKPWDRHPAYVGPMDSFIYVFDPIASDERAAAEEADATAQTAEPTASEPLVVPAPEPAVTQAPDLVVSEPAKPRTRRISAPQGASATKTAIKTTTTTARSRVSAPRKKS